MSLSSYFLLGPASFAVDLAVGATKATVKRMGVGSNITQTEKDIAGSYYNSITDSIDMAEIHDLNFGPNYISKLGASDEFMALAQTKQYKDAFKKATGKNGPNLSFAQAVEAGKNWESMPLNTNANGKSERKDNVPILRYPINQKKDSNFDYLQISAYKNEPAADMFNKSGKGSNEKSELNKDKFYSSVGDVDDRFKDENGNFKSDIGRVYLPMQPGLQDATSVSWNQDTLNPFEASLAGASGGAVEGASRSASDSVGQGFGNATGSIKEMIKAADKDAVAAFTAQMIIGKNVLGRTTGKAINNNLELLFTGPTLRTFAYSYRFTPREERESLMIRKIIRFFKKSMSPIRSPEKIFLESPNVFRLKYIYGPTKDQHPYLNKIKMCSLQSFDVQYTPDGSYSTYDDGSMTSYQLSLQFGELNPIYADDYDESDNDMGY